jgi:hypothetical protein
MPYTNNQERVADAHVQDVMLLWHRRLLCTSLASLPGTVLCLDYPDYLISIKMECRSSSLSSLYSLFNRDTVKIRSHQDFVRFALFRSSSQDSLLILLSLLCGASCSSGTTKVLDASVQRQIPQLRIPSTTAGQLTRNDLHLPSGAFADDFRIELQRGQPITIVTRGGPSVTRPGTFLDVYTFVLSNGHEVARDDDSARDGGAGNSRIVFTPSNNGTFVLRVSTFGPTPKEGPYTLQTYLGALPEQL